MKKLLAILNLALITLTVIMAQAPQAFKYQAIARDNQGNLISNKEISLKISIMQGSKDGIEVYSETHKATTNAIGLVSLEIGKGEVVSGTFSSIAWGLSNHYVQIALDEKGGDDYKVMGTSELLSVPYAIYAASAGEIVEKNSKLKSTASNSPLVYNDDRVKLTTETSYWTSDEDYIFNTNYGNVGIGPYGVWGDGNDPPMTLSVFGNAGFADDIYLRDGAPGWGDFLVRIYDSDDDGIIDIYQDNTVKIRLHGNGDSYINSGDLGIGTSSPHASAKLDVTSTTQGFLPPRMTTAQQDAISSPAAGLVIYNKTTNCLNYYNGTYWMDLCGEYSDFVVNPTTGKTWMDRNLGASQVATSSTDADSYGDLYQWGRAADGHESRTSGTTTTLSSSDTPGHGNFILTLYAPYDWRSTQNDNLWQGVGGINNPCPDGYRLPTIAEWDAERQSWSSENTAGAFASPLKLPMTGGRSSTSGSLNYVGSRGSYWSSTVNSVYSYYIIITSSSAGNGSNHRAGGVSVRCIKD